MSIKKRLTWPTKLLRSTDNAPFLSWLRDQGSLTVRLQSKGEFAVRILRRGLFPIPTSEEAMALNIRRNRLAWVRDVTLLCDGKPLVFAHTALPYRPRGPMTGWLARLGNHSLGALIFLRPRFGRDAIHFKRIDHRHVLFDPAIKAMQLTSKPPQTLWARRSRFTFGAQFVLVTEVFSPQLCNAIS